MIGGRRLNYGFRYDKVKPLTYPEGSTKSDIHVSRPVSHLA